MCFNKTSGKVQSKLISFENLLLVEQKQTQTNSNSESPDSIQRRRELKKTQPCRDVSLVEGEPALPLEIYRLY